MEISSGNTGKESGTEEGGFKRTFKHEEPPVEELVPPDGGWGWLIVLACGIMQVGKILSVFLAKYQQKCSLFR